MTASKNEAGAILCDGQESIWTFNQLFEIEDNGSTFREAHALLLALQALPRSLLSPVSRVIINTDNIGLFHSLLNNGSESSIISSIVHQINVLINSFKIKINYKFISGSQNPADAYSRIHSHHSR